MKNKNFSVVVEKINLNFIDRKTFKLRSILKNISFSVKNGEFLCIDGPSGSGKTSLAKCLNSEIEYFQNKNNIFYFDIENKKHSFIYNREIEYIKYSYLQKIDQFFYGTFPNYLTLKDVFYFLSKTHKIKLDFIFIEYLFKQFRLSITLLEQKFKNMSGGELQRCNLILIFFINPKLIIFDEAFSALDIFTKKIIIKFFLTIKNKNNELLERYYDNIYIFITHDNNIKMICNKFLKLKNGVAVDFIEQNKNNIVSNKKEDVFDILESFFL